jgi:hypothetical protein
MASMGHSEGSDILRLIVDAPMNHLAEPMAAWGYNDERTQLMVLGRAESDGIAQREDGSL